MSLPHAGVISKVAADYIERLVAEDGTVNAQLSLVYCFLVPDAATSDIDIVVADKCEVVDAWCIKRNGAGAGNTMQIKNGATAITDAMACATDDAVTRAASIVDGAGTNIIAAGGTLRLTATKAAGTRDAQVFVRVLVRP